MSVNGSGLDRKTNKPQPDSSVWELKTPAGELVTNPKDGRPYKGNAHEVFAAARTVLRLRGIYAVPVRN